MTYSNEGLQAEIRALREENASARADLRFLDAMERVELTLRRTDDFDTMLENALDEILAIFSCDRAWLLYPCDPDAEAWGVPTERTAPSWPGVFSLGVQVPMNEGSATILSEALATSEPLPFDPSTERQLPQELAQAFSVRSQLVIAVRPRNGKPWLLGIHHCATTTTYSPLDIRLLQGVSHRMAHALDTMLLLRDLRSAERAIAKLARAEAIGTLAAGIAHDFNNKILVVLCASELLREQFGGSAHIDQVTAAANKAAELTSDLLAFSRQAVLHPRPVDLTDVVHANARLLRKALGSSIQLQLPNHHRAFVGQVDPTQLEQVLVNLVMNARDALPQGGTIRIVTTGVAVAEDSTAVPSELTPGHYVTLSITDDGTGMDVSTMAEIFEPFFTTKRRGKGTGLGLSTAYGVARQSGGTLTVSSTLGQGSTFTLWLPETLEAPALASAEGFASMNTTGGTERLLLVIEDHGVAAVTKQVLVAQGYSVTHVGSSKAALRILEKRERRFDLILSEIVMADMDGVSLCKRAVQIQPGLLHTLTTGYSTEAIERVIQAGPRKRILQMPYTPSELLEHVRRVLDDGDRATVTHSD